jgi:hypothetical protein
MFLKIDSSTSTSEKEAKIHRRGSRISSSESQLSSEPLSPSFPSREISGIYRSADDGHGWLAEVELPSREVACRREAPIGGAALGSATPTLFAPDRVRQH